MEIVDVLGANVRPVVVPVFHTVGEFAVSVQVPLPMFKVRVLLLLEEKEPAVTLKFAAVNVPWVRVSVLAEPSVIASARVTVMPEPFTATLSSCFPLLVTVAEAKNTGSNAA